MGKNNGNFNLVCEKEFSYMGKLTRNPGLMCKKIYSRTPVRDFCCFYPCEIILSHIPIPGKDKKQTAACQQHAGCMSISDIILMVK